MKETRKLRAGENAFAWLMMALSLFVLIQAYLISGFSSISSAGTFPMVAAAIMVVAMALTLLNNRKLAKPDADGLKDELRRTAKQVLPKVFLVYTGIIIGYMLLIQPLHFLPSSFAFLLVSMIYLKGSTVIKSLIISTLTLACIYIVFQYFFRVVLP
ncbi:MAG: tripartite tricarboxylate transporter TctB family protein [Desulfobacterales bacterium]